LNHSNTSESTRREIGCFAAGATTVAASQKSSGKSANSDGEVALISSSDICRSRARSARPRCGGLRRAGRFFVCFTLTTITLPSRNDSSIHHAAALGSIGIHHGEQQCPVPCRRRRHGALRSRDGNPRAPVWHYRRSAWRTRNRTRAFWVFPSQTLSTDPCAGVVRRHHVSDSVIQDERQNSDIRAEIPTGRESVAMQMAPSA